MQKRSQVFIPLYRIAVYLATKGGGSVIENFGNKIAQDIWEKDQSSKIPADIWVRTKALLTIMHATSTLNDLKLQGTPPALRAHKLKGDREGEIAIDIDGKSCPWRIVLKFKDGKFSDVKIEDYH